MDEQSPAVRQWGVGTSRAIASWPIRVDARRGPLERPSRRLGWLAAVALWLLIMVLLGARHGGALTYVYPAGCLIVGLYLFVSHPGLFVGWVLWLWLLSPLVRRLSDYQAGYSTTSLIIVTPLLVTALTGWTAIRHAPRLRGRHILPFLLAVLAATLGLLVGIFQNGVPAAAYAWATWVVPILYGVHLTLEWKRFPEFRRVVQSTMVWGSLTVGCYGAWQYFRPQVWDQYWMIWSKMASIGVPEPHQLRVFSTLNSPGVLAAVGVAALITTFATRGILRWPAAGAMTVALLLSTVRSAWLACILSLLTYVSFLPGGRRKFYSLLAIGATALLVVTILFVGPVRETLTARVQTFQDVSSDQSYRDRVTMSLRILRHITTDPLGGGMGSSGASGLLQSAQRSLTFDNGVLEILFVLGWIGGFAFLGALAWAGLVAFAASRRSRDPVAIAGVSAWVGALGLLISGNSVVNASGACFWGLLGLAIASRLHQGYAAAADAPARAG